MAGYLITLRAPDIAPDPTDAPTLVLPPSPYAAENPVAIGIRGTVAGTVLRLYDGETEVWSGTASGEGDIASIDLAEGTHDLSVYARAPGRTDAPRVSAALVVDRPPTIAISIPAVSYGLVVPVTLEASSDAIAYLLSESSETPAADDPRWLPVAPGLFEFSMPTGETPTPTMTIEPSGPVERGTVLRVTVEIAQVASSLYAWAKDEAGQVSARALAQTVLTPTLVGQPIIRPLPTDLVLGEPIYMVVDVPQDDQPAPITSPPYPDEVTITTEGDTFAPLLAVNEGTVLEWIWSDGTHSRLPSPTKRFAGAATRTHRLRVIGGGVSMFNVGFDRGDGGSSLIPLHPQQNVSALRGLQNLAASLRTLCVSQNKALTSINLDDLIELDTFEAYWTSNLATLSRANTPKIGRFCVEDCALESLDMTSAPLLRDLRGAVNDFGLVRMDAASAYPLLWHICIRGNPTMQLLHTDFRALPKMRELFLYASPSLTGTLRAPQTAGNFWSCLVSGCRFSTIDLTNAFPLADDNSGEANLSGNPITALMLEGCPRLRSLRMESCGVTQAIVDYVLATLDGYGQSGGTLNLSGNAAPSATGQAHATSLRSRGWTVTTA